MFKATTIALIAGATVIFAADTVAAQNSKLDRRLADCGLLGPYKNGFGTGRRYKAHYTSAGFGRTELKTEREFFSNPRAKHFNIKIFSLTTCKPLSKEIWYKNGLGKNVTLGNGSDISFDLGTRLIDRRRIRAWKSSYHDIVFFISSWKTKF